MMKKVGVGPLLILCAFLCNCANGVDIKKETQQGAQNQIDDINGIHPNWGSRIWQIYKTKTVEVLYPIGN